MRMSLAAAAKAMSANVADAFSGLELTGAAMDSRTVRPGDLFFCLPGAHVDGHDFAGQALHAGAAAVVAARPLPEAAKQAPVLQVQDTVRALGELGRAWRDLAAARVVGVTGSAGKTTVKEMLAHVCSREGGTCRNHLNWNNQIGLPLSLLACQGPERFWIMEAGISRPGDMEDLGRILAPDLVLVVNAGSAHLEALGDVQGVARAKASLLCHLRRGGEALVNRDCAELWQEARDVLPEVHGFSTRDAGAEFYGRRVGHDPERLGVELRLAGRTMELSWPLKEAPLLENVLAVAGTAVLLGIGDEPIIRGLTKAGAVQGRFQIKRRGGWVFIDDTYNANPLSMRAALARARELAGQRPLVCVLGDMLELGREAAAAHRELGRRLAGAGCSAVLYHGLYGADVQAGLVDASWTGSFLPLESPQDLVDAWKKFKKMHGVALFKGSRAGAMETYLEALCAETAS